MRYKFYACGHPNILGTHKTTLEFTKDEGVSLKGDCIVGIKADFDLGRLKEFIESSLKNNNKKILITIKTMSKYIKTKETISAELNPDFNSNKEFVIRKTDFVSERTFAIRANKAAFELNRDLIRFLKDKNNKVSVIIENKQK
ncbi:DUF371 domain-containing protein [Candidatus Woesearchaeota archaeon]|nr:DUF371 domain-containing protein [Candidatus Woesearchaeota archaeon]